MDFIKFPLPPIHRSSQFTHPSDYFDNHPAPTTTECISNIPCPPATVVKALATSLDKQDLTWNVKSVKCPHASSSWKHHLSIVVDHVLGQDEWGSMLYGPTFFIGMIFQVFWPQADRSCVKNKSEWWTTVKLSEVWSGLGLGHFFQTWPWPFRFGPAISWTQTWTWLITHISSDFYFYFTHGHSYTVILCRIWSKPHSELTKQQQNI